ncbi:MAG: zinc ribbon domain-containing protein [Promethearchaeota archaeon]|nr:MAG: zinc ribbon domain-containing protein [Candidatus Lokiarchaeota archaeon]
MSKKDINSNFAEFGSKMQTLGILAILLFVFGIISNFVAYLGIVNLILWIISLIIFFSALGEIKEVAYALNNRTLHEFRSKIIYSLIIFFIGYFFLIGGLIGLAAVIIYAPEAVGGIIALAGVIIIAIILIIISVIFEYQGWSRFQTFINNNMNMFPANIGNDASSGASLMKIAAILKLTIILIFIAFILNVIGYFKLSSLKNMMGKPTTTSAPTTSTAPAKTPEPARKFCPNCGSPVTGDEKFCSSCGAEL